jgi:hypothetical protein
MEMSCLTLLALIASAQALGNLEHREPSVETGCACYSSASGVYCDDNFFVFWVTGEHQVAPAKLDDLLRIRSQFAATPNVKYTVTFSAAEKQDVPDLGDYFRNIGVDTRRTRHEWNRSIPRPFFTIRFIVDFEKESIAKGFLRPMASSARQECTTEAGAKGLDPEAVVVDLSDCIENDGGCIDKHLEQVSEAVARMARDHEIGIMASDFVVPGGMSALAMREALSKWKALGPHPLDSFTSGHRQSLNIVPLGPLSRWNTSRAPATK